MIEHSTGHATIKRIAALLAAGLFIIWANAALAQERIQFRSLDTDATRLDAYLYRAAGAGPHLGD